MRCTDSSSADCCAAFDDDETCRPDLTCSKPNFIANRENNFTCGKIIHKSIIVNYFYEGYNFNMFLSEYTSIIPTVTPKQDGCSVYDKADECCLLCDDGYSANGCLCNNYLVIHILLLLQL